MMGVIQCKRFKKNMLDIEWYNGDYKIDKKWDIFSFKKKNTIKLKDRLDKDWYKIITLWKNNTSKTYKVHRLVLIVFIWEDPLKKECNHMNWIKDDNRLENLEWVTPKENSVHRYYVLWHKWCVKQL